MPGDPQLPPTASRKVAHSALLGRVVALRERLSERAISDAFIASLSTRRLDWRSALASWAHIKMLPLHDLEPTLGTYSTICEVCGALDEEDAPEDDDSLAAYLAWPRRGATGRMNLMWNVLDLEDFESKQASIPTPKDVATLRDLIEFLGFRAPGETSTTVVTALTKWKRIAGNKYERAQLVDTLGLCGVMRVPQRPAPLQAFTPPSDRELPPNHFIDRAYPVCWWRGADGVNLGVVRALFGHRIPL